MQQYIIGANKKYRGCGLIPKFGRSAGASLYDGEMVRQSRTADDDREIAAECVIKAYPDPTSYSKFTPFASNAESKILL